MSGSVPPRPDVPGPEWRLPQATWRAIEAVPVFFLAVFASTAAAVLVEVGTSSCSARFVLTTLAGEVMFGVVVVFWIATVNHGDPRSLAAGFRPLGDLAVGALVGLGLVVVAGIVVTVVQSVAEQVVGHAIDQPEQVISCVRGVWLGGLGPVVVVAAPVGEEMFFRGFLYRGLRRRFSVPAATALTGIWFGLVHFGGVDFLLIIPSLMVVGAVLALLYERRGSLLACMAAHAAFNLVGYLFIATGR